MGKQRPTQSPEERKSLGLCSCKIYSDLPSVRLNMPCCLWDPEEEAVKGPTFQYFSVALSSSVAPALRQ